MIKSFGAKLAILVLLVSFSANVLAEEPVSDSTVAYRFETLELKDPNIWGVYWFFLPFWQNVTDDVNDEIAINMIEDDPSDGFVDASFLAVIRNYDKTASTGQIEMMQGKCPYVEGSSPASCAIDEKGPAPVAVKYAQNSSGFSTEAADLGINLIGIRVQMTLAQLTGVIQDDMIVGGKVQGFVTQEIASSTILPWWLPLVGDKKLSDLLANGDRDRIYGSEGEPIYGWWFAFDFTAKKVAFEN